MSRWSETAKAGTRTFTLGRRVAGRTLKPGTYTLTRGDERRVALDHVPRALTAVSDLVLRSLLTARRRFVAACRRPARSSDVPAVCACMLCLL